MMSPCSLPGGHLLDADGFRRREEAEGRGGEMREVDCHQYFSENGRNRKQEQKNRARKRI
jgi:hypothetical protein